MLAADEMPFPASVRGVLVGGGPVTGELLTRALDRGLPVLQTYGLSETASQVTTLSPADAAAHAGSAGKPLVCTQVRVNARPGEQGEILVSGPTVMRGYFDNPRATSEALRGGWLHTGDAGYLEPDGHLVVLGRLSDVVHTAKGERYIPNYIENRLKFSPYVKDVAVLGEGRDWLGAIICIDRESVGHWAELRGISYMSYADLAGKPEVMELVTEAVRHVNLTLPEPLRLRRFVCLHKEFDADDGEVTRTRKLRRTVVEERYAPIIDAVYAGQEAVTMKAQITYETGEVGVTERLLQIRSI
jgi:long-chain acyl-CoA synthetase